MSVSLSKRLSRSPAKDSVALSEDKELVYVSTHRRCAAGCQRFFISDRSSDSPGRSRTSGSSKLDLKTKQTEECPHCHSRLSPEKRRELGESVKAESSPYLPQGLNRYSQGKADSQQSRTAKPFDRSHHLGDTSTYESSPEYVARVSSKPSANYSQRTSQDKAYEASPEYYRSGLKAKGSPSFADKEFRGSSDELGVRPRTVQFENSPSLNPLLLSGPASAYRTPEYRSISEKGNLFGSSGGLRDSELRTVSATSKGSLYPSSSRPSSISDFPSPLRGSQDTVGRQQAFSTPQKLCTSGCGRHRGQFNSCVEFFQSRLAEGKDIGPR
jgi:hypothetical protein